MSDDVDLRERIGDAFDRLPVATPRRDAIVRRARILRVRRLLAAALAASVVLAGVAIPIGILLPLGHETPPGLSVDGFGIRLDLPGGWDGRVTFVEGMTGPLVEAATFQLPPANPGALFEAARAMGPDELVLSIRDYTSACPCEAFQPTSLPITFGPENFESWRPDFLERTLAFAHRAVEVGGRALDMWVMFGSNPPPQEQLDGVNRALSSLQLDSSMGSPDPAPVGAEQPPTFLPAPGWQVASTGPYAPETFLPLTWAANVPFRIEDLRVSALYGTLIFHPTETLRHLPPDGIVVLASLASGDGDLPERELPLHLSDFDVRKTWEGQVAPTVPEYVFWVRVGGQNLDVRVYFGTLDPSPATLQAAQEELLVHPTAAADASQSSTSSQRYRRWRPTRCARGPFRW